MLGVVVSGDDDDAQGAQVNATRTAPRQAVHAGAGADDAQNREVAIALIGHVQTMEDLRAAWTEVGRMGMQKDEAVIAAKNQRKEELS